MKMAKLLALIGVVLVCFVVFDQLWIQQENARETSVFAPLDTNGKNLVLETLIENARSTDMSLDVTYAGVPTLEYHQMLKDAVVKPNASCLLILPAMQTAQLKKDLMPLDDLIKESDIDMSEFANVALRGLQSEDKQYALPYSVALVHLFYNKDLFKKAGRPEPTNEYRWDTFIEDVDAIGNLGPDYYGYSASPRIFDATIIGMLSAENERTFINNKLNLDSQKNVETLNRIFKLFAHPKVYTPVMHVGEQEFKDADKFVEGKTGMVAGGQWLTKYIKDRADINLGYASLPSLSGHPKGVFSASGIAMVKSCPDPQAAFEVMKKLLNRRGIEELGVQQKLLPALQNLPASISSYMDKEQIDTVQYLMNNGINLEFSTTWNDVDKKFSELTEAHDWKNYKAEKIVNQIIDSYGK